MYLEFWTPTNQIRKLEHLVDFVESASFEVEILEISEFVDAFETDDVLVVGQVEGHQLLQVRQVEDGSRNLLQVHVRQIHGISCNSRGFKHCCIRFGKFH